MAALCCGVMTDLIWTCTNPKALTLIKHLGVSNIRGPLLDSLRGETFNGLPHLGKSVP